MAEPRWVDRIVADAVHLDQIREHGGLAGVRDEHALEAALARPRQKWHYEPETSMVELAAAYGFGLSRGHPYRDGNKRVVCGDGRVPGAQRVAIYGDGSRRGASDGRARGRDAERGRPRGVAG